ncbi:hypothetical protein DYI37_19200 [Fulvimarina endophytica]|uniref:Uncharacterized protein n=1 Tax=Fulvimarina endophytica TaxID=2293836 RepID=A0A371WXV4_9HYPH|nr:hypothetical protein [Fulvimarina endophytica]RFC61817.1 hypothetical protein DYI37_19200 [Fulvimarina endophytica]
MIGFKPTSVEGALLESAQNVLLLATIGLYGLSAVYQGQADRMASVGASVLAAVLFLRELELPNTGPITAYLNSDAFRLHEAVVVLAIAIPYLVARWRFIPGYLDFLQTRHAVPFVTIGIFLLVGDYFDGVTFHGTDAAIFIEELSETLAYLAFLLTGWFVLRNAQTADHSHAFSRC